MSMNYSKKNQNKNRHHILLDPLQFAQNPSSCTHDALPNSLPSTPLHPYPLEHQVRSLLVIDYGSAFNTIVPLGSLTKLSYLGLYSSDSGTCGSWSIITWMGSFTQQDRLGLRKAGYSADKTIKAMPLKSERHQQCRTRAKRIAGNPNSQQQIVFSVAIRETLWSTADQDRGTGGASSSDHQTVKWHRDLSSSPTTLIFSHWRLLWLHCCLFWCIGYVGRFMLVVSFFFSSCTVSLVHTWLYCVRQIKLNLKLVLHLVAFCSM